MKKIAKWVILVLGIIAISISSYFICKACGITDTESLRAIIEQCGAWGWLVYVLLFVVVSTFLCFVPVLGSAFIVISIVLFGPVYGFILSVTGVFISSSVLFIIGKKFGLIVAYKIVGPKELNKAQDLLDAKSKVMLPLMFLFPIFPDDALCLVAGITKMKYLYFSLIVLIFRSIGIATYCFLGSGFINWAGLNVIDWFVLINVCLIDIGLIFKYQPKIEDWIRHKKNKGE